MNKKQVLILAAMLVTVSLWAQRGPLPGDGPGSGPCAGADCLMVQNAHAPSLPKAKETIIRYFELTAEQVTAWEELISQVQAQVEPLRAQVKEAQEQLAQLLQQENPDPAAVGTLILQIKGLHQAIEQAHAEYEAAFEALLNTEQAAKLVAARRAARLVPVIGALKVYRLL